MKTIEEIRKENILETLKSVKIGQKIFCKKNIKKSDLNDKIVDDKIIFNKNKLYKIVYITNHVIDCVFWIKSEEGKRKAFSTIKKESKNYWKKWFYSQDEIREKKFKKTLN